MKYGETHIAEARKEGRKTRCLRCGTEYYARARSINITGVYIKTNGGLLLYRQVMQNGRMFSASPVNLCQECADSLDNWFESGFTENTPILENK